MSWFQDFIANQVLSREAKLGLDVATGQKSIEEAGGSYVTGNLLDSGLGELQSATDNVDAATKQFADAGMVSPGATDALGNVSQEQLYSDAVNIPTTQQYPQPSITSSGLQDSGIVGQGGQIKLDNNALNPTIPQQGIDITNSQPTGVQLNDNAYQSINTPSGATNPLPDFQFDGYTDSGLPTVDTPEEAPGTFLGLEGKDYAKMGVGAGLNAAVGMAMRPPTPQKPTPPPTPNRPGAYQAPQQSQGMAQTLAVNSNANPAGYTPMTQAQGLLNPFERDRYRRGQY